MSATTDHKVALVYGPEYLAYNFGPDHPLQPIRLKLTYELIRATGILGLPEVGLVPPRLATDDELELVHLPLFVEKVKEVSQPGGRWRVAGGAFGLGTEDVPVFEGMHEASAFSAGGSIVAIEQVMEGHSLHAFNVAGGLHHAHSGYASGFCVYNDAAVAIARHQKKHGGRIMYVDLDVHHGDGVQDIFYDTSSVLTVSIHESGDYLFPGTGDLEETGTGEGIGYSVNVPLEPMTFDRVYLDVFRDVVPPLARAYRPDLIVTQMGCDTHMTDPLAQFMLTLDGFRALYSEVHKLVHEVCGGRWVALGGGGYQARTVVPKAWTLLFAEMCGVQLGDEVPISWAAMSEDFETEPLNTRLRDDQVPHIDESLIPQIESAARGAVEYVEHNITRVMRLVG